MPEGNGIIQTPLPTLLVMGRHLGNRWGGVYEVLRGLLTEWSRIGAEQGRKIELLVPRSGLSPVSPDSIREVVLPRFGGNRLLWDHWTVPSYARAKPNAILYNPGIVLPFRLGLPALVSIHDALYFPSPLLRGRPEYLAADAFYMRRMIARSMRHAAAVHVPSNFTAAELRRIFPALEQDRVRMVPYGVDPGRWGTMPQAEDERIWRNLQALGVGKSFLLHVGGVSRRKNLGVILEALRLLPSDDRSVRLVLVGGAKPTRAEPSVLRRLDQAVEEGQAIRLGEVDENTLRVLYRHARALVYPSRYEGFGLPPLEAQAAGCPVVCAHAGPLPDVVPRGALFFEPDSPADLVGQLNRLESPELRQQLIQAGFANAGDLTWRRSALKILEIVDSLNSRPHAPSL